MNAETEAALRSVAESFAATRQDLVRIAETLCESTIPMLPDFAAEVLELLVGRTFSTYRHHIRRLASEFSDRRLDEVSLLELDRVAVRVRSEAMSQPAARHGYGAQETFVNATRFVFTCAVRAGHLRENPALGLARPRRRRSSRRALSAHELEDLFSAVLETSRDPELDLLILAFARETACRRDGLINLRRCDLLPAPAVVLYEKFDERREIPVTRPLSDALHLHANERAPACDRVFHYASGDCLTDRRFDTMFQRVARRLPWAAALGVTLHWVRYSTLTDIRMTSGERVAAAYAGHSDESGGVTGRYTRASFEELQAAHHRLFGT